MELAGAVFLVNGVEADGIAGPVPAGMKIAAKMAGDISPEFHIQGSEDFAFLSHNIIYNQRLVELLFAVGSEPVLVRCEAAVAVEIQEAISKSFIIAPAIGKKVVALAAIFLKGCDDFLVVAPIEVGNAVSVGDYLTKFGAVKIGGEHAGLEPAFFVGAAEKEKASITLIEYGMIAPHMTIFEFGMAVLNKLIEIEDRNGELAFACEHIHNEYTVIVGMRNIFGRVLKSLIADSFAQTSEAAVGKAQGVFAIMA